MLLTSRTRSGILNHSGTPIRRRCPIGWSVVTSARVAADGADQRPQFVQDDVLPQVLVRQPILAEKVVIEEVAVGTVPDVVQQRRQPYQALDVRPRRRRLGRARLDERIVQVGDGPAGQVHRPQDMLEPRVLGRRKNPPGSLQLVDVSQPLEPGMRRERRFLLEACEIVHVGRGFFG